MPEHIRVSVSELRNIAEALFDHLQSSREDVIEVPDRMFWAVPADTRYDVYSKPTELSIGQLSESFGQLESMRSNDAMLSYGLVWLADVLRAIGEQEVR